MEPGQMKLAQDKRGDKAQFAHLYTDEALNISTPVVLNATKDIYVSINTPNGGTYIYVNADGATTTQGKYVEGEFVTIVRAGEYLGADVAINVCPIGELPSA